MATWQDMKHMYNLVFSTKVNDVTVCQCQCCLTSRVGHNIDLGKTDTVNTTSNYKVDLFTSETKSVIIYVLLWFD